MADVSTLATRLRELLAEATPGDLETAECVSTQEAVDCPACGGEGQIDAKDYTNFDGVAVGVQFFGIGKTFGAHEALWRFVVENLPTIIRLLEAGESAEKALDIAQEALSEIATGAFLGASTAAVAGPAAFAAKLQSLAEAVLATLRAAREGAR